MTQKILAAHAGLEKVEAGQFIEAKLDMVLGNDITAPVAIKEFHKMGADKVFHKEKIALVPDHFTPNKDIKSAEQCKYMREFAHSQEVTNYFEIGEMGIEHALLPEKGLVVAGDVVIGADSHTCTYGALGAFSTGVGSTDMAAGMAIGETWFKVPSAIKFNFIGKLSHDFTLFCRFYIFIWSKMIWNQNYFILIKYFTYSNFFKFFYGNRGCDIISQDYI